MRTILIITAFLVMGVFSVTFSEDRVNAQGIYNTQIDEMISFYKARLYLKDSEFKVLADIALDAQKMITFLEARREQLVMEMAFEKIDFRAARMQGFILKKARHSEVGLGYTKPE